MIRAFRALLVKDDVADMGKFIWTVAYNTLSNCYRDAAKSMVGVSIDEVSELIANTYSEPDTDGYTQIRKFNDKKLYRPNSLKVYSYGGDESYEHNKIILGAFNYG